VRDFGAWRSPREGDRGRGLSLMRALMDTVDVVPGPEGTTVRMRRTLLDPKSNGDRQ
jgi:anti-sigma regulatory factor (Ser/Thr protein kinase)